MAREKFMGIYWIINLYKGKIYIGSSIDVIRRLNDHVDQLLNNKHPNQHMQKSFNKYGREVFDIKVIEFVEDKEKLIEREQYWIDSFVKDERDKMYNICLKAGNSLGYRHTEETKQKMSEQRIGKKLSSEHRESISKATKGENNPMYGKHRTEEEKRKISDRYYPVGENNPLYGKKHSKEDIEHRSKLVKESGALKGENNGAAKLTEEQVIEIKILIAEGKYSQVEISRMFNIGTTQISYIKLGKSWSHVKIPS